MEKSTISGKIRIHTRLLKYRFGFVFALLLTFSLAFMSAQQIPQNLGNLVVSPENEWFFTGEDACFVLKIPEVAPKYVTVNIKSLPSEVKLVSLSKEEYLSDEEKGTFVRLWVSFSEEGEYKLPALGVQVSWKRINVPFESVKVYKNPTLLKPELLIKLFDESGNELSSDSKGHYKVFAGHSTKILVSVLYAAQVMQLNWQLPKNALFSELKRYPVIESNLVNRSFSPESEPVVLFDWVPMDEGEYQLPFVSVSALSYGGQRMELKLPEINVFSVVDKKEDISDSIEIPNALEEAFQEPSEKLLIQESEFVVDYEATLNLARLRVKERFSLPFSKYVTERKEFEKEHGLHATENEHSFVLISLLLCFAFVCLVLAIFMFIFKKKVGFVFLVLLFCATIFFVIVYGLPLTKKTGVFVGGVTRTIPELSGNVTSPIMNITLVKIVERTGNWLYIESSVGEGWVTKDSVIEISKKLLNSEKDLEE